MSEPQSVVGHVYSAILQVMGDLAKTGVGKNKTNASQNFQYRGIDDVMDALAAPLVRHGLLILPSVQDHHTSEHASRSGGTLFHTLLKVNYEFISVKDGSSKIVGPIYGEAMDSGDKSTNKAMSIAYKYACVLAFNIPITGDDPDAHTHDVAATPPHDAQASMHRTRPVAPKEPTPSVQAMSPAPARPGLKPTLQRPGGIFGYGRKNYDVPWNVMKADDLHFFLHAERTPQHIRERIVAELAWRDYETEQLEAGIARQRAEDAANPISDDIP